MSHDQSNGGSDRSAAFAGLIGGALFIGAILYSIVLLTNNHFKNEAGEKKTGAVEAPSASVVG
ncbi:MAG: hypothetical protein IPP90_01485 [Gemmatimonadaceae bacterium]|nr:hypothetical protein [Gemmatimonadaceae bacterium]